jgi:hypothetical protein
MRLSRTRRGALPGSRRSLAEVTGVDLKRKWLHQVVLLAERVRGVMMNSEVIFSTVGVLSATPLTHSLRRDGGDFVVFCFGRR